MMRRDRYQARRLRAASGDERGNILLTVILIVAVMATLAVAIMDDIRFAIRRSGNIEARAQAHFYAAGAEDFAAHMARSALRLSNAKMTAEQWARDPLVLPIEGGIIRAGLEENSNCFNLNALVSSESGRERERNDQAARLFTNLLQILDFGEGEAERLTAALVDWLDYNGQPEPGGAEDYAYTGRTPASLAANTLMAEVSELRGVEGVTPEVFVRLRPHVCVHPTTKLSILNVNMLKEEDAPLIVMLVGRDKLTLGEALGVIAETPPGGYASPSAFWALEAFAGKVPPDEERALVSLKSRYFNLMVQVDYLDAAVDQVSLMEIGVGGDLDVVSRRYGVAE